MKLDGYDPELLNDPNHVSDSISVQSNLESSLPLNKVNQDKRLIRYFRMIKWVSFLVN